jgi:hypothetical protein
MQTDKILISSTGAGFDSALEETTKFAEYLGLDRKQALRVRLLAEETLGMVSAITGDFNANFYLESEKDFVCRIHLVAETVMDYAKKKELIEASTNKKNSAAKGFMGKIRQLIENSLYSIDEVGSLQAEYGGSSMMYANMGMNDMSNGYSMSYIWTMENYRNSIESTGCTDEASKEAWDELEKSIVASIADDVKVGVKGNTVELIIEKKNF